MYFDSIRRILCAPLIYLILSLLATTMFYISPGLAASEIPDFLIKRNKTSIDPDLLLSAKDAQKRLNSGSRNNMMLVDVRSSESFNKVRIPGSINIPLFALKTKTFLKTKQLVLVNEGYGYHKLVKECKRLRKEGFKSVCIMKGGLNAWQKAGEQLDGDIFVRKELNKIPPQSFFEDKDYGDVVAVNVYSSEFPEEDTLIPGTINIPLSDDVTELMKDLKRKIATNDERALLYVVIVSEDGLIYESIEGTLEKRITESIFYLKGGLKGYREFLKHQALILQPKKVVKTKGGCPSCD